VYDIHDNILGYDITSLDLDSGELRLIETKGVGDVTGTVLLTPNERRVAEDRRDGYWLYVVTNCDTTPQLQTPIRAPQPASSGMRSVGSTNNCLSVDVMTQRIIEGETMDRKKTVDQTTLDDIIRRIVDVAHPEKIILFGSAAREEMGPNSDVDLLVIKSGAHRLDLAGQIYMNLHGVGEAVDIIVVTPEDVERYRDSHALVIAPALREGKVVYAA
jgi:uncharacterized protein